MGYFHCTVFSFEKVTFLVEAVTDLTFKKQSRINNKTFQLTTSSFPSPFWILCASILLVVVDQGSEGINEIEGP